ncbi:uncharacterized protein LACBIDRAFT_308124 [Laccaria bicolor S238N-H82]|uniref:Predicted protein n=1 Tax=Laccaria bicolor (strain S238N-H82 / ATCC MYA-4686) TaxID=486041 RepID=B0E4M3_LACBS|nr:uncharacterized protein LACBIDRAFT_308124 [Laccaria bicolor S238N-H82]EDQ98208.1 predicted protein [Laccaria bicolor S238N-H82]|eukprot:XP_001891141.1 predicted protein [Laccaria bicolor S238N-H82]
MFLGARFKMNTPSCIPRHNRNSRMLPSVEPIVYANDRFSRGCNLLHVRASWC